MCLYQSQAILRALGCDNVRESIVREEYWLFKISLIILSLAARSLKDPDINIFHPFINKFSVRPLLYKLRPNLHYRTRSLISNLSILKLTRI